jgi:NTE family protein
VLFHPVKREGCLLSDGGIADRPGLDGMNPEARTFYHHIASRSPWRRAGSKALQIPRRDSMVSLRITDLPRANPFHLERGVAAMQAAQEATKRALGQPIVDSIVSVAG